MTSYCVEVQADSSGKWDRNNVRLPTEEQAEKYRADLAFRWTAVRESRTAPTSDPANYVWNDGLAMMESSESLTKLIWTLIEPDAESYFHVIELMLMQMSVEQLQMLMTQLFQEKEDGDGS